MPFAAFIQAQQVPGQPSSLGMKLTFLSLQQLTIRVYDSQLEDISTTRTLDITMRRNENPPEFIEDPYRVRVDDWRILPGTSLVNVSAPDADGVCCFRCFS